MDYCIHGHRHADYLFSSLEEYNTTWFEVLSALDSINDQDIIDEFESEKREAKSISQAINRIVKKQMLLREWQCESYIFADHEYGIQAKGTWRLDFAKGPLSMEVAFNHRSDIAWNLIKPTLASELNHVQKAIQTSGGIIVTATQELKEAGGFDNACGSYEDYVQYLKPLYGMLPAPLAIIGLKAPESFKIDVVPNGPGKKKGIVALYAMELKGRYYCPACGTVLNEKPPACECGQHLAYRS